MEIDLRFKQRRNDIVRSLRNDISLLNYDDHVRDLTGYLNDYQRVLAIDDFEMRFAYATVLCQQGIEQREGAIHAINSSLLVSGISELEKCISTTDLALRNTAQTYLAKVSQVIIGQGYIRGVNYPKLVQLASQETAIAWLHLVDMVAKTKEGLHGNAQALIAADAVNKYIKRSNGSSLEFYVLPIISIATTHQKNEIDSQKVQNYVRTLEGHLSWEGFCVWANLLYNHHDFDGTAQKLSLALNNVQLQIAQSSGSRKNNLESIKGNIESVMSSIRKEIGRDLLRTGGQQVDVAVSADLKRIYGQVLSYDPQDKEALYVCGTANFSMQNWNEAYLHFSMLQSLEDGANVLGRCGLIGPLAYSWHKSQPTEPVEQKRTEFVRLLAQYPHQKNITSLILQLHHCSLGGANIDTTEQRELVFGYDPLQLKLSDSHSNQESKILLSLIQTELEAIVPKKQIVESRLSRLKDVFYTLKRRVE